MKKLICLSLLLSVQAYSDQEFPLGPTKDKTDGLLKYYCRIETAQNMEQSKACLDAIKSWAGEDIVATCADDIAKSIIAYSPDGSVKYMDMVGSGAWHTKYHKDKDGFDHRHAWSESSRDEGGRRMGTTYIDRLRKNSYDEQIQKGTSTSKGETISVSGGFSAGAVGSLGDSKTGGSGTTQTWTYRGPSDQELDEAYRKGYIKGYEHPDDTGLIPDIACERGDKTCYSSNGSPKNDYPKSDPPPVKAPEKTPSRTSSNDSSTSPHAAPDIASPSHETTIMADNDDLTIPDTTIATVQAGDVLKDPLKTCVALAIGKKYGKDGLGALTIDQSNSSKTPEQEKEVNRQMLKMGVCNESYWGVYYCEAFNKKLNFGMAPTVHGIYVDYNGYRIPGHVIHDEGGFIDTENPDDILVGKTLDFSVGSIYRPICIGRPGLVCPQ